MSSQVRLLPTLMGAAGVLLALRIGAMAATPEATPAPAESAAPEEPAGQSQPGETSGTEGGAHEAAPPAGHSAGSGEVPGADASSQPQAFGGLAQSKGEADVLHKLADRRSALDARERDLGLREQLLLAAEKQIAERMAGLKSLEQKLDVLMAKRNELEETQIASLVKSYENMKPDDAARIFNRLERSILVDVSSRMKPAKIGAVLAAMEPSRAQDLTVMLAKRMRVSQLAPVPQPVAATPAPELPSTPASPEAGSAGGATEPSGATPGDDQTPVSQGTPHS